MNGKKTLHALFVAASAALLLVAASAYGDGYNWIGPTSGTWSASGNWDPVGGPPGAGDDANFINNIGSRRAVVDANTTVDSLLFSYAGSNDGFELDYANGAILTLNGGPIDIYPTDKTDKKIILDALLAGTTSGLTVYSHTWQPGREPFSGVQMTNAGNTFVGNILVDGGLLYVDGGDGTFGDANNDITLQNGGTLFIKSSVNFASGRVLTFAASGAQLIGNGQTFTINDANQFAGSGLVTVNDGGSYGTTISISASQTTFTGGFTMANPDRRVLAVSTTGPNQLGMAGSSGTGGSKFTYAWGAQQLGGAGDGGKAGVTVSNDAMILLNGSGSLADANDDRFIVNAYGVLEGGAAQLGAVTRVSSFSPYGTATGPEVMLATNAVVAHTTVSNDPNDTVQNLGTASDLLYGLGTNHNSAAFSLTIGANTPWKGLASDTHASDAERRLQKGTVVIDDGGGTFTEMVLLSTGTPYTVTDEQDLFLGNGADCPNFVPTGQKVVARVLNSYGKGQVTLDSTAPLWGNGISKFIVGGNGNTGILKVNRSNGLGGVPVDVMSGGAITAAVPDAYDANVSIYEGAVLQVPGPYSGTGILSIKAGGIANLTNDPTGLAGTQPVHVDPNGIVRWYVDNPNFNSLGAGAVLEYYTTSNSNAEKSLGGFDANGQILTTYPIGWHTYQNFIKDAAGDGISGSLIITAPTAGSGGSNFAGYIDIRENFETGSEIQCGSLDSSFAVEGYTQRGYVWFVNTTNDMALIQLAGAGVNGGTIAKATVASIGSADIEFVLLKSIDAGGSRFELSTIDTVTDGNVYGEVRVIDGAKGILHHQVYQGLAALHLLGGVTLGTNADLVLTQGYGSKTAIDSNIVLGSGSMLDTLDNGYGGTVSLAAGKSIAGAGTLVGNLATNIAGSTISPGMSIGTLSVVGNVTLEANAALVWELGTPASSDLLDITGNLTLAAIGTSALSLSGAPVDGNYTLIDYSGSFSGDVATFFETPVLAGYTLSLYHDTVNKAVMLGVSGGAAVNEWAGPSDDWSAGWTASVPDAAGAEATFGTNVTGDIAVNMDQAATVGVINVDVAHDVTLSGANGLTLDGDGAAATISLTDGAGLEIAAPVSFATDVDVTGNGTFTLSGAQSHSAVTMNVLGGTTVLASDAGAALSVSVEANLVISANQNLAALTVSGAGQVDVTTTQVVLHYGDNASPIANVASYVASGAIASSDGDVLKDVGYADNTDANTVTLRYTWKGDATLDGSVTGADLAALATNWNKTSGAVWAEGDFNHDGAVTGADLAALATNWNKSLAPAGAGAVPEPATVALLGLGAVALLRRRRR